MAFISSDNNNYTNQNIYEEEEDSLKQRLHKFLNKNSTKGIIFISFCIVLPFLVYFLIIDLGTYKTIEHHTCYVGNDYKISCGKRNATKQDCIDVDCCYDPDSASCYHYLPAAYYYYSSINQYYIPSRSSTPYGNSATQNVSLTISEIDADILRITLHDSDTKINSKKLQTKLNFDYELFSNPLTVQVYDKSNKNMILTTSNGPLIISEQYWEWSFQMRAEFLYGLNDFLFKSDRNATITKVVYSNENDHSTLPVFMAYNNGTFNGLIVRHKGPLEIIVYPSYLVTLRGLVGGKVEIELQLGPTIKDVVRQQGTELRAPPSWTFGTHICRNGNTTDIDEILNEYDDFVTKNVDVEYDSDCVHENLFLATCNLTDAQKNKLDKSLSNTKLILSLPPHIPVDSDIYTKLKDIPHLFYENSSNQDVYMGKYLGKTVVYPSYFSSSIVKYREVLFEHLKITFGKVLENIILSKNWLQDDSSSIKEKNFPYLSEALSKALRRTLPWNSHLGDKSTNHILEHNEYAAKQIETLQTGDFANTQFGTFAHNFSVQNPLIQENINATWSTLRQTIKTILSHSLFGRNMVSVPICGSTTYFDSTKDESLCIRWYLIAQTTPFFRISSELPRRDPDSLFTKFGARIAKEAMVQRKKLRGYFRSVMSSGEPLMRPMFYDFGGDNITFSIEEQQYMVGDSLLVVHPMRPETSKIKFYLPKSVDVWYEFRTGAVAEPDKDGWNTLNIIETDWICYIRCGKIVPEYTVNDGSTNNFQLRVGLNCPKKDSCSAAGRLIIDKLFLDFESSENELKINGITDNIKVEMDCSRKTFILSKIIIYNKYKDNQITNSGLNLCDSIEGVEISIKYK